MRDFSILDDLAEGVQIIGPDLRYVYLNKVLLAEVKMASEDIVGFAMTEKFPGIDQTEVYEKIAHTLETSESHRVLNEFKFPDGRQAFYQLDIQPIAEGAIVFSRDITTTRRGELLLRETNRDLEHFASVVAHDLREPVRRIAVLADSLLVDHAAELSADAAALCERLHGQTDHIMSMIGDFRQLAGFGRPGATPETFDLVALARSVHDEVATDRGAAQVPVQWPDTGVEVTAHRSLIAVLLRRLIDNVVRHGAAPAELTYDGTDGPAVFRLSNRTLRPLPDDDIFQPYVKARDGGGTGLGLSIARKVVHHHHGRIWSETDGDRFTVAFVLEPELQADD